MSSLPPKPITEDDSVSRTITSGRNSATVTLSKNDAHVFDDHYLFLNPKGSKIYVHANNRATRKTHSLHRLVYPDDIPDGYVVHHLDHNPCNNVRSNLEAIPAIENNRSKVTKPGKSGIKGVHAYGQEDYRVGYCYNGRQYVWRKAGWKLQFAAAVHCEVVRKFEGLEKCYAEYEAVKALKGFDWTPDEIDEARILVAQNPEGMSGKRRKGNVRKKVTKDGRERFGGKMANKWIGVYDSLEELEEAFVRKQKAEEAMKRAGHKMRLTDYRGERNVPYLETSRKEKVLVDEDTYWEHWDQTVGVGQDGYPRVGNTRLHKKVFGPVPPDKDVVDHKSGDKLDCRRDNLEAKTFAENNRNRPFKRKRK